MPQFLPQQELMAVLFLHSPVLTGFPEVENETDSQLLFPVSLFISISCTQTDVLLSFLSSFLFALNI